MVCHLFLRSELQFLRLKFEKGIEAVNPSGDDELIQPVCGIHRTRECYFSAQRVLAEGKRNLFAVLERIRVKRMRFSGIQSLPDSRSYFLRVKYSRGSSNGRRNRKRSSRPFVSGRMKPPATSAIAAKQNKYNIYNNLTEDHSGWPLQFGPKRAGCFVEIIGYFSASLLISSQGRYSSGIDISENIASTGHSGRHASQSIHVSGLMRSLSGNS